MSTFTVPIVTVKSVTKHPNADALDLIEFEEIAWRCVDKRGIRKPGDLVVYVPIDSVVDTARPEFAFLAPRAKKDGTVRIRTIRLRGEISQGLVIDAPSDKQLQEWSTNQVIPEGSVPMHYIGAEDVSGYFDIKKYEPPPETIAPMMAGNYPGWCERSDAERYQNFNRSIEPYQDELFYKTLKLDGSSCTVFYEDGRVGVCSRNWEVKEHDEGANKWVDESERPQATNIYWRAARDAQLIELLPKIATELKSTRVALQGEICGPGIQKNKLGLINTQIFAFDIFDGQLGDFISYEKFLYICALFNIKTVPILNYNAPQPIRADIEEGFSWINSLAYANGTPAEGVVYVAREPKRVGTLGRLKFKFINPEFLLKYE